MIQQDFSDFTMDMIDCFLSLSCYERAYAIFSLSDLSWRLNELYVMFSLKLSWNPK